MIEDIGSLAEAPDAPSTLWRFMDFTKYVAMLHQRALFFARADQMPDPFEGFHGRTRRTGPRANDEDVAFRQRVFLNCWHENRHESAAMWRMYLSAEDGVAVRSSVARLREELSASAESIRIGKVRYVDSASDARSGEHELDPFFCKRTSFESEREVRLLWKAEEPTDEVGRYVRVNLDNVIEQVVVCPTAEGWLQELVRSVTAKYGLKLPVVASTMLDPP